MLARWRRALIVIPILLLFAGLSWWATRSLWTAGSVGNLYDWGWPLTDWQRPINHFLWSWDGRFLGQAVVFHFGWIMAGALSAVGTLLGLGVQLLLKIWLVAAIIGGGTGMTWLLRRRGQPWWIAIVMGVVYALYPTLYVRFIVGFVAYILAYALLPWWMGLWWSLPTTDHPRRVIPAVALIYALMTSQQQFSAMILLVMLLDIWLGARAGREIGRQLIALLLSLLTLLVWHLPWLWLSLRGGVGLASELGQASSSLALISSLPHDLWRSLFGFDHHITYPIFDSLRYGTNFAVSCLVLLGLFYLGVRQSRSETRLALVVVGLSWPLALGPVDATKSLYIWVYQHMPLANLFRETYHWSVLIAFFLVVGASFGLTWLWRKRWLGSILAAGAAVVTLGLARPYIDANYYNHLVVQRTGEAYADLTVTQDEALKAGRSFFLPALGFIKDKSDKSVGAANSDILAESTNRPQLPYASSSLDLPDRGSELRNAMLASWYQLPGAPVSATGYLRALGVTEVITRPQLVSNFIDLFPAKSLETLRRHWATADYDRLTVAQPAIEEAARTESWTKYTIKDAAPKITLAERPVVAANDWSALASANDAVFYREDLIAAGRADMAVGLPVVAERDDWLAAGWRHYDYRSRLVVDAGSDPTVGWVKKNSVWWRSAGLAQAREAYYFTSTDKPIAGEINIEGAGEYRWLLKLWHGPRTASANVRLDDQSITVATHDSSAELFVWHDLGVVELTQGSHQIEISGQKDTSLAQWLLVPESEYTAALADWPLTVASNQAPTGEVSFTALNPTAYDLTVTVDREAWLIVRESYDAGWELRLGEQVYRPVPVNGYAMAFSVPGGSWTGQLVFAPQLFYRILQITALLFLGGLLLLSLWTPPKRKRRQAISLQ